MAMAGGPDVRTAVAVRARNRFGTIRKQLPLGVEQLTITTPQRGPGRAKAEQAVVDELERNSAADRRVKFALTFMPRPLRSATEGPLRLALGSKGGYNSSRAAAAAAAHSGGPFAWIRTQAQPRMPAGRWVLVGVDITSYPAGS